MGINAHWGRVNRNSNQGQISSIGTEIGWGLIVGGRLRTGLTLFMICKCLVSLFFISVYMQILLAIRLCGVLLLLYAVLLIYTISHNTQEYLQVASDLKGQQHLPTYWQLPSWTLISFSHMQLFVITSQTHKYSSHYIFPNFITISDIFSMLL